MPAAVPCKIKGSKYEETHRIPDPRKTKDVCTDESTRKRLDGTLHKDHEDHIAGKRNQSTETLQSSAQIYS